MGLIFNCGQKCEKVCVQVKKVFDACRKELSLVNQEIVVTNVNPDNPVTPLTYVGSKSSQTKATINNLVVTPLNNGNCARYSGNITIPLTVSYTDDNDKTGNGSASLTVPFDIILSLPPNSIMPYSVEAIVSASSSIGNYTGEEIVDNETQYLFTINICVLIIIKLVMETELIIDSHGYAEIPLCTDYGEQLCDGFFSLPLFP